MKDEHGAPIMIRKKRVDGEEEHHGGVWKLAFADFMTAMMAFFLVMWLINSTSKETKAAIVQYLNPVQLIDSNPAHKGLRDPTQTGQGKSLQQSDATTPPSEASGMEAALHKEPLKTLDEIARREPPQRVAQAPDARTPRDPFDRLPPSDPPPAQRSAAEAGKSGFAGLQAELDRISRQEGRAPKIDVARIDDGVLISLTDDARFSMFGVGSIEPKPQLVRIIAQIAKVLSTKRGEIEIRGHTDGRSYAGKSYDNWRLSADRATMVNYMLLRGGLAPQRIGRIVGYADHRLKLPNEPLSPMNRRIEILLRGDGN